MPNYDNFHVLHYSEPVAASDTDEEIVAAVTGRRIVVVQLCLQCGDTTPTAITFQSGPVTAIAGRFDLGANQDLVLPYSRGGWFATAQGEALVVTTGAGATISILVGYVLD